MVRLPDSTGRGTSSIRRASLWLATGAVLAVAVNVAWLVTDARLVPVMGFRQTFFDDAMPGAAPRFERITKDIDLACLDENPSLPRRNFRVRWEGIWHVSAPGWTDLYVGADDRGVVWLDGRLMIERSVAIGMGTERVRFLLTPGDHHLVVEYEQIGGDYHIGMLTGPAGDTPHSFADEAVYPSTPGRKTLTMVEQLSWLRRATILAWGLLAFALFVTFGGRWFLRAIRELGHDWLARHGRNWRRWRDCEISDGGAGTVSSDRRHRPFIAVLYVLVVVAGLALFGSFYDARTGFTPLIVFGGRFEEGVHPAVRAVPHYVYKGSSGYDGQFYAQLAVDPNPRSPALVEALDSVPYRAKRILLSWSAFLLGCGRPAWVLQAYAVQNILVWVLLAVLLRRWLPPLSIRHWAAWCGCLFSFGLIFSVRFALTEGPSLALIALAIAAAERRQPLLSAAILGVSGLSRETSLVAAAATVVPASLCRRPAVKLLVMALLLLAPLLLWLTYLRLLLGPRVWMAGGDNLTAPFVGLLSKISKTVHDLRMDGWASPARDSVLALVGTTVQVVYLSWRAEWQSAWWRTGLSFALLGALLASQVWEGNPGAFTRVLLPMTVAFNVLIPASRRFWPIFILGNVPVVTSFALLLEGLPR